MFLEENMEMHAAVLEKVPFTFPVQVLKYGDEAGNFHIVGYAATTDFDLQGDVITEEALQASSLDLLKNSTVLLNHDVTQPIGRVTEVKFDKHGLLIDALISKTEPDIIQKIKEGVLNKFSIRGQVLEREKKFMPDHNRLVNVIKRMALVEVSLVSVPANPEAKAIGWYLSKAIESTDSKTKGGNPMPEEIVIEELPPEGAAASPVPAASADQPGNPKPEAVKAEAGKPAPPAAPVAAAPAGAPAPSPAAEPAATLQKQMSDWATQLEPLWFLLDKLIAMGGPAGPVAQQIKAMLKHMIGDTSYPYPSVYPYPKPVRKDELEKMIAGEVAKQVESALKAVPTLRKGLVQPEAEKDELRKRFESLPPEQKLRAALALQRQ